MGQAAHPFTTLGCRTRRSRRRPNSSARPASTPTAEEVIAANPEVVIAAWCGAGDRVPLEKIIRDRHWENTTAARTNRVYCIRDEFLNTPAPTLIQGLHALAWTIWPELIWRFSPESAF